MSTAEHIEPAQASPNGAAAAGPAKGGAKAGDATEAPVLRLKRLREAQITLDITGLTPVVPHKWSEKALELMRKKQFGETARPVRAPKDPAEEARDATYWLSDGRPGVPATAFKSAMVSACRFFEGISMVSAKALLFVVGEGPDQLVPIEGPYSIWEATPRNAGGVVDLRYRNRIFPWSARITVRFLPTLIDAQSVVALLDAAGRLGVGDWRPSSPKSQTGVYGQWKVTDPQDDGAEGAP